MRRIVRPRRVLFPPVPGWAELVRRYSLEPYIKLWCRFDQKDGNLLDYSGLNNHLAPAGAVLAQQFDFRGRKSSVFLNGVDAYYAIADAAQTGLNLNGAELGGANLGFEVGDFTDWTEIEAAGSSMTINAVAPIAGLKDAKMHVDDVPNTVGLKRTFGSLAPGTQHTVQFKYTDDVATNTIKYYIKDSDNKYLQNDDSWGAAVNWFTPTGSITTKLAVKPFTLSASAISIEIYVRNNAGTICDHWLDDFSISECRDAVILVVAKSGTDVTTYRRIIYKASTIQQHLSVKQTTGVARYYLDDGTNSIEKAGNTAINDNVWRLIQVNVDRDSATGLDILLNGVSDLTVKGDITPIGNLNNTALFGLGSSSVDTYFLGSIAEVMILTGAPLLKPLLSNKFALDAYELTGLRLFQ